MNLLNSSYCELIGLASTLSIYISKNFSSDDLNILSVFFSALGDNLAISATTKALEDTENL